MKKKVKAVEAKAEEQQLNTCTHLLLICFLTKRTAELEGWTEAEPALSDANVSALQVCRCQRRERHLLPQQCCCGQESSRRSVGRLRERRFSLEDAQNDEGLLVLGHCVKWPSNPCGNSSYLRCQSVLFEICLFKR